MVCSLQEGDKRDHSDKHSDRRTDTSPRRGLKGPMSGLWYLLSPLLERIPPLIFQITSELFRSSPLSVSLFSCWCLLLPWASLMAQMLKICLWCGRPRFSSWVRKIPWRREWLPTPVFLPREFHQQRSLADYSLWGNKELDMAEWLTTTLLPEIVLIFAWCLSCPSGT